MEGKCDLEADSDILTGTQSSNRLSRSELQQSYLYTTLPDARYPRIEQSLLPLFNKNPAYKKTFETAQIPERIIQVSLLPSLSSISASHLLTSLVLRSSA